MFLRMILRAFLRQWKKMLMIAFTIALGSSLATAMLCVMKVNQELKTYGANIKVVPKDASIINELYETDGENMSGDYLREDELGKIKTIFWAFNIVDYAPFISTNASLNGSDDVTVTGTWFNHHMDLPTGETLDAGVVSMRSWWEIIEGDWIDEQNGDDRDVAMVGKSLAEAKGIKVGDTIDLKGSTGEKNLLVSAIYDAGVDEISQVEGISKKLAKTIHETLENDRKGD